MSNEFFTGSGYPSFGANGDSSSARSEFLSVQAGFDKLPIMAGHPLYLVQVNAGQTALEAVAASSVIGTAQHAATTKTTPVDADELPLMDSAASYGLKKFTWSNLKATLKTYLDTLYASLSGATFTGSISGTTGNFSGTVAAPTFAGNLTGNVTGELNVTGSGKIYGSAGSGLTNFAAAGTTYDWALYDRSHTVLVAYMGAGLTTLVFPTGIAANVTGNITGNITGNVTGNVTGSASLNVPKNVGSFGVGIIIVGHNLTGAGLAADATLVTTGANFYSTYTNTYPGAGQTWAQVSGGTVNNNADGMFQRIS